MPGAVSRDMGLRRMTRDEGPIEKSEVDQPVPGRLPSVPQPRENTQAYGESASYRASTAVCQTHRFFQPRGNLSVRLVAFDRAEGPTAQSSGLQAGENESETTAA